MPTNPNDLLNWEDCAEAKEALETQLDGRQVRDVVNDYSDRQAGRLNARAAQRLTGAIARMTSYSATLAQPDVLPADRKRAQLGLITATADRDRLLLMGDSDTGAEAYLSDVEAERNDREVAFLTDKLAEVATRRGQLTAY